MHTLLKHPLPFPRNQTALAKRLGGTAPHSLVAAAALTLTAVISLGTTGAAQGWVEISAPGGPSSTSNNWAAAFDSAHGRLLTVVGPGTAAMAFWHDQTRSWTSIPAATTDSTVNPTLAYDSHRDRFVRFGGESLIFYPVVNSTWEYDPGANTWQNVATAQSPPPRTNAAMAFDSNRHRMVLFGGQYSQSSFPLYRLPRNDTWEFDGVNWLPITTSNHPPGGNTRSRMAYDSGRGRMLLHVSNQTWEYDGQAQTWSMVHAAGPGSGPVAFDSIRNVLLLWNQDAHEFDPVTQQWATVAIGVGSQDPVYFDPALPVGSRIVGHSVHTGQTFEYRSNAVRGSAQNYGTACDNGGEASFRETFTSTFDLAGTSVQANSLLLHRLGSRYDVMQGSNQWFTPPASSANLLLGDDAEATVTLPFALPLLGIMTPAASNQIVIGSNGYVIPTGVSSGPGIWSWISFLDSMCAICLADLDPTQGGTIKFDIDPNGAAAYVTWTGVPAYGQPGSSHTFQLAMFASGDMEYRYRQFVLSASGAPIIVGWSPGQSVLPLWPVGITEPADRDLTASIPFRTGCERPTPHVNSMFGRPIINGPMGVVTTQVLDGTFGVTILGFTKFDPGIDLTPIGMNGCQRYAGSDWVLGFVSSAGTGSVSTQIPNWPILIGVRIYAQSAIVMPGVNGLGLVTTEGIEFLIGEV